MKRLTRNSMLKLSIPIQAPLKDLVDWKHELLRTFACFDRDVRLLAAWRAAQGYRWFFQRTELAGMLRRLPDDYVAGGIAEGEKWMAARPVLRTTGSRIKPLVVDPKSRISKAKNALQVKWDCYDPKDTEWMYSINRHQFLPRMAAAARREGRDDLAERVFHIMDHWIANCPSTPVLEEQIVTGRSSWGRHWKTPWQMLNCGLRVKAWLEVLHIMWDSSLLTPGRFARYVESMRRQALVLGRTSPHSDHEASGNHLIMETGGLLLLSLLPWLKESRAMRKTALHNLARCLQNQVLQDGAHVERVPGYHLGTISWFAEPLIACALNGFDLPGGAKDRVRAMAEYAPYVLMPDRKIANFGDCAAARNDAALYLAKYLVGIELPWKVSAPPGMLLSPGRSVAKRKRKNRPLARWFPHGGFASARNSWSEKAHGVVMHVCRHGGGHSHSDWMSIIYAYKGRTIITERGVNTYDHDRENMLFRVGRSHNILQVGERDAVVHQYSLWDKYIDATAELVEFHALPAGRATWTGRQRWLDGTTWTRKLDFHPDGKLVVEDMLGGGRSVEHAELRYHLNTVNARIDRKTVSCVTTDRGMPNIRIVITPPERHNEPSFTLTDVNLSPSFSERTVGKLLCFRCKASAPMRWKTVITGT